MDEDTPDQIMAKQEMIYNLGGEGSKSSITAYELYRFMEWVISAILGLLFTIWAFVPEEILASKLGIIQFPNRYWILAMGNFIGMSFLWFTLVIWGTAMMNTNSKESYFTMQDRHTKLYPAPKRV